MSTLTGILSALLIGLGLTGDAFNLRISLRRAKGVTRSSPIPLVPLVLEWIGVFLLIVSLRLNGTPCPKMGILVFVFAGVHWYCLAYPSGRS